MNFKEDIKEATGMETTRNQSACERRWGIIQHDVNKFCAAYDQATSTHLTGRVQLDVLEVAHQIYAATNDKKRFTLEHAWAILRQHVKWSLYRSQLEKNNKSVSVKRSTKKKPTTSDFMSPNPQSATITLDQDQSSTPINDTSEIKEPTRPIGRKAAKAAKASEAAESKKRSNDVGADIAAANMKLANASNAKVKIAAIAVADARQALDDKIMLNSAPQNLDEIQMEYWRERRAQIAKRLHQKNSEISISGNDAEGVAEWESYLYAFCYELYTCKFNMAIVKTQFTCELFKTEF